MYEQITSNKRKSFALFAGFLLIYAVIAGVLYLNWGPVGSLVVGAIAVGMTFTALWGGDDMAVRVAGGRKVERKEDAPELWRMVENLAITGGRADATALHLARSIGQRVCGRTHAGAGHRLREPGPAGCAR